MMQANVDLSLCSLPHLENLEPHSYYVRIRPLSLSGATRAITLNSCPLVNIDINNDGLLLGVEIIDTGPYREEPGR